MPNKTELTAEFAGVSALNPWAADCHSSRSCMFASIPAKSPPLLQIQEPPAKTDTEVTSKKE